MALDREKLKERMAEQGLTPRALSLRIGDNPYIMRDILSGKSRNPRSDTLAKIEAELGARAGDFEDGVDAPPLPPELTELPLIGQVRAGMWQEVDDSRQDEHDCPMVPVSLDRRYPHARQWLREVVGDSMNARGIHEGDFAHMVDFVGAGVTLESGKVVEVTRFRDGGLLREVTLKEVEVTTSGILLWPRSINPIWKDPIRMDLGDGQDLEVQVTGLLLNAFRRF